MWIFALQLTDYQKQQPSTSCTIKAPVPPKLDKFCVFIVPYHIRPWFSAVFTKCPQEMTLTFTQALQETNKAIREQGLKALERHMWYLSELTVGLAVSDDELSLQKQNTVANL